MLVLKQKKNKKKGIDNGGLQDYYMIIVTYTMPPSSRGLGHFPFTEVTGIRIPLGVRNVEAKD